MINPLVAEHTDAIAELCRRYQVRKLDLFGSAATDEFNPDTSDVDFLVTYQPDADLGPWACRFLELETALAELLDRPVDLVFDQEFRNPYFRKAVEESRTPFYEAPCTEAFCDSAEDGKLALHHLSPQR